MTEHDNYDAWKLAPHDPAPGIGRIRRQERAIRDSDARQDERADEEPEDSDETADE